MVTRLARLAPLLVGVIVFSAARLALLPGLAFWDTGELQAVAPLSSGQVVPAQVTPVLAYSKSLRRMKSRLVLAKVSRPRLPSTTMSPGSGTSSSQISTPQVPFTKALESK